MKQQKSFTLIEILVVIVVIGVLSAFILVGMSSITNSANIAKGKAFLNSMDNSLLLARVSQWKFDEAVGSTTVNDSWGINTGTLSGAAPLAQFQTTGCPSNNCLSFDGTDDYVLFNNAFGYSTWSFSAWIKPTVPISGVAPVYGIYSILEGNINESAISINGSGLTIYVTQIVAFNFNNNPGWHNVIYSYNGTQLTGIVDGNTSGTITIANPLSIVKQHRIGIRADGGGVSVFNGSIDDVRIYNQAIPTSEIQQNYYIGLNKLLLNNGIAAIEYTNRLAEVK
jgi:prepilin-type N-terminal cleavage/methylation domain-containing protein